MRGECESEHSGYGGVLPYLELPTLGPISSFGVLVMIGMFFGVTAGTRHAERLGLDVARVRRIAAFCGVGTLLGAHYVDLFFYQPGWADKADALWTFFNPFAGISSYGGLLGGTLGFLVAVRKQRGRRLRYADAAAVGAIVFLTFGRAGCASVHDHVGVASDFALAIDFPANNPTGIVGPHHDLGLYELALFLIVILPLSAYVLRTPRRPGWFVGFVAVTYAVPRFFLDSLRREVVDPRYFALTPAQWGCVATFAIGLALLVYTRRGEPPEPYRAPTPWRVSLRAAFRFRA
jgi:phosphatidylglycerol---prolipoprotein diacylglyceryl transferase